MICYVFTFSEELDQCKIVIEQLEEDKMAVEKIMVSVKLELKQEKSQSRIREQVIADLQANLDKVSTTLLTQLWFVSALLSC